MHQTVILFYPLVSGKNIRHILKNFTIVAGELNKLYPGTGLPVNGICVEMDYLNCLGIVEINRETLSRFALKGAQRFSNLAMIQSVLFL